MKTMKKLIIGLIAAGLMMSATTAYADDIYIEGHLSGINTANPAYVGLTGAGAAGGGGWLVGYEMDAVPGLRLMGIYAGEAMVGDRFSNDLSYDWSRNRLMAGADYGVDLFGERLRPLARLAVGYSYQSLGLTVDNRTYRDGDHGLAAQLSTGVELSFGRGDIVEGEILSRLSVGFNFLMGYLWQTEADFSEMRSTSAPSEPNEEDPWTRGSLDAGSLQMSGTTWTVGAVLRYHFGS